MKGEAGKAEPLAVFSSCLSCLCILFLVMSFKERKFYVLMKLNLSLFFFRGCPFIVILDKRFPSSSSQMCLLGRLQRQLLCLGL